MNIDTAAVADLNNEAVSFLQEGNYREAVFSLEMGLERLRQIQQKILWYQQQHQHQHQYNAFSYYQHELLQQQQQQSFYDGGETIIGISSVPIAPSSLTNNNNNNNNKNQASSSSNNNNNVFEFYRKAFRIVVSTQDPPSQWSQMLQYSSGMMIHQFHHPVTKMIVIKFNMAICYHDDGIRRNRTSHLYLALDLYQEILHLMETYCTNPFHHHINNVFPRGYKLLLMAIGNNMGHIHSHLMNFEQTRTALYWVRHLTIQVATAAAAVNNNNRQGEGDSSSWIPYDDYAFFYKTVRIFSTGNDLIAAPAA